MSIAADRQTVANVLDSIDGVKGHMYRPKVFKAGDAWALSPIINRAIGSGPIVTWTVVVILPQDERKSMEWFDTHVEALMDTLSDEFAYVEDVDARPLPTDDGDLYVMLLLMRKEA
jgi:hypothetical protein